MKTIATFSFTSDKGSTTILTFSDAKGEPNYNGTDRIEINSNSNINANRCSARIAKAFEAKLISEGFTKSGEDLSNYED